MQGYQINNAGQGFVSDIRSLGSNQNEIKVTTLINELIKSNVDPKFIVEIIKYDTFIKGDEGYFGVNLLADIIFEHGIKHHFLTLGLETFNLTTFKTLDKLNESLKANYLKKITREDLNRLFNYRSEFIINPRNNYFIEHVVNKANKKDLKKHLIDLSNIVLMSRLGGELYEVSWNQVNNKVIIASISHNPLTMSNNELKWLY